MGESIAKRREDGIRGGGAGGAFPEICFVGGVDKASSVARRCDGAGEQLAASTSGPTLLSICKFVKLSGAKRAGCGDDDATACGCGWCAAHVSTDIVGGGE